MSFPLFRVTLNNTTAGPLVINEPGGWDDAVLKLERNEEYHSLVEFYDQPLLFYGQGGNYNGGYTYINFIRNSQGPDAQISIRVEVSEDEGTTYGVLYDGLLDITSIKENDFYKLESGVIRNDFWQKFINRKSIDADLSGTTDMDGNSIACPASNTLNLSSQTILQNFERMTGYYPGIGFDIISGATPGTNQMYFIFANSNTVTDEISERFEYGCQVEDTNSYPPNIDKYIFKLKYAGSYSIALSIRYLISWAGLMDIDIQWKLAIRTGGTLTEYNIGSSQSDTGVGSLQDDGARTYSNTFSLDAGDEIFVYALTTMTSAPTITFQPDYDPGGGAVYTSFTISADTTFPASTADTYTIGNAAKSILSKVTGNATPLKSSGYLESQCGGYYAIAKGLHIRGYTLAQKPFSISFDDLWAGINPILCLGLGYTTVSGVDKIEIEKREAFYNTTTILNLDYVNLIETGYDTKKIFKSIEVGYEKWSAESDGGTDDPQTKRTYRTRFKTVGEDTKILSKFIAASLAIEQTRRNTVTISKDWRLDDDVLIISLKATDITTPELSENFTAVSGLNNYTTRYNIRLSCARLLMAWRKFFNGCLNWYTTNDDFAFASGEGNYDMASTMSPSALCAGDGVSLSEKQDIDGGAGQDFMFIPITYSFTHPLSFNDYKLIRDNRKNAIGVSRTNSGHVPCHIMSLEYHITKGYGKFNVLLGQTTPIS
jgi:hypothetical protein